MGDSKHSLHRSSSLVSTVSAATLSVELELVIVIVDDGVRAGRTWEDDDEEAAVEVEDSEVEEEVKGEEGSKVVESGWGESSEEKVVSEVMVMAVVDAGSDSSGTTVGSVGCGSGSSSCFALSSLPVGSDCAMSDERHHHSAKKGGYRWRGG